MIISRLSYDTVKELYYAHHSSNVCRMMIDISSLGQYRILVNLRRFLRNYEHLCENIDDRGKLLTSLAK